MSLERIETSRRERSRARAWLFLCGALAVLLAATPSAGQAGGACEVQKVIPQGGGV